MDFTRRINNKISTHIPLTNTSTLYSIVVILIHVIMDTTTQQYTQESEATLASSRSSFIRKTYLHLAGSIAIFAGLTALLVQSPVGKAFTAIAFSNQFVWLGILFAFAGVSWVADRWARSDTSKTMQYLGLGLYVLVEAIIFTPLLFVAANFAPGTIELAGFLTIFLTIGLTVVAFISGKDFSFLKGFLSIGFFLVIGVLLLSIFFGPLTSTLSLILSAVMILFAAGAILYETSNIIRHYRTDQYVAASLALFASVALLFWYLIQLILGLSNND